MKSKFDRDRIVLGEMNFFQISQSIPDDIIYPDDFLGKEITSVSNANTRFSPVMTSDVKKRYNKTKQPQHVHIPIIICIEYQGVERLYRFTYNGIYNGKRPKEKKNKR